MAHRQRVFSRLLVCVCLARAMHVTLSGFCCTPPAWRAATRTMLQDFAQTNDSSTPLKETTSWQTVNYDFRHQRISLQTFEEDNTPVFRREVLDFMKSESYVIEGESQQNCTRHPLRHNFTAACVPDGTTGIFFAGIAGMGENTVYFKQGDVTGYVTVTLGDCALVQEVVYSESATGVRAENVQFMNQTLAVDPAAFSLPASCHPSTVELSNSHKSLSILGKLTR